MARVAYTDRKRRLPKELRSNGMRPLRAAGRVEDTKANDDGRCRSERSVLCCLGNCTCEEMLVWVCHGRALAFYSRCRISASSHSPLHWA